MCHEEAALLEDWKLPLDCRGIRDALGPRGTLESPVAVRPGAFPVWHPIDTFGRMP